MGGGRLPTNARTSARSRANLRKDASPGRPKLTEQQKEREREAQKKELFDEAGVTGIMERAANAARRQTSAISVDPADPSLKQKPLPGLE